ncbi:BIG1-domain-containing protein [Canariomyces notabilis]|uniref:Protein BIG1 n=1 Tax=Canariomyces notabilis TaxID=2074819 RepID=A0AAN6THK7_9PEZI|nr:BIG1-domain-containing protein [Canariomyces arenarius]
MQLPKAATLLACTAAVQVQAFSNSSPFVLFSTASLPQIPESAQGQLQTSAQVLASAKQLLASCPTERYILVSQPNLHAADIRDDDGPDRGDCRMPFLCRAVAGEGISHFSVAEVVGQVSGRPLDEFIKTVCAEKGKQVHVDRVELKHLPPASLIEGRDRREVLEDNDFELDRLLETLDGDYTVFMFSDPNEFKAYEPEFIEAVHVDLKRWAEEDEMVAKRKSNSTSNLPLFEKYQFFTPGVFMSLFVLVILLSILAVGLKALSSLEVSYGAFDKEMGPAAQKKQM